MSRKPQYVTRHGKPVVVVLAEEKYDRLRGMAQAEATSLAELVLAMPQGDKEF